MNPFRTGKLVLFQVTYDRDWHFFEVIFFVILGIFGVRPLFCPFYLAPDLEPQPEHLALLFWAQTGATGA